MNENALHIEAVSISEAWTNVFFELMQSPDGLRHPALIVIKDLAGSSKLEDAAIRTRLDEELARHGLKSCRTVAGTIFPRSMWNPELSDDAAKLYARYDRAWPAIKKCPANKLGVYFRRLTSYAESVNQLDFIVKTFKRGNHRRSALQAAILDPSKDHAHNRIRGFPCLQQVSFTPLDKDRLSITGYYGKQCHFEKSYGNYLGLHDLGQFMAKQLDMKLDQVVCIASSLDLGGKNKSELAELSNEIKNICEKENPQFKAAS